ncbi:MAG: hypothetical protein M4D80_08110 [Myxococcota bacterium]|nr:hypothetical protein [Myxococcota bacterium]
MSLRPAVLDDGLGGRIVGWPEGDLAAMELQKWEPARPAPKPAVATRLAITPPPIPLPKPPPIAAPVPVLVVPAPVVAQAAQVDEDDWEWEIALAHARVAAEESEQAAASVRAPRARLDTIPPPTQKLAVLKIPPKHPTQQLPVVVKPPAPLPLPRPGTSPATIIPIPRLPSIKDRTLQIQPVVSSSRPSRTRLAKGTGPVIGTPRPSEIAVACVAPPPPIRAAEPNDWAPEDNERTIPGLPPIAATVSLPSITKRFAR